MDRLQLFMLVVMATLLSLVMPSDAGRRDGCRYYRRMCKHEGTRYERWDTWSTDDCYDCTCLGKGYGYKCCQDFWLPMIFDESQCEAVWDKESCSYSVVNRNPADTTPCEIFAGILK
ncbi:beta-microseminoprotein-like [Lytechinus variegatus]|uniref:beta-microseminoprotein-like n=1 Tax=Lytechinus variegatus TaxID=7654 RepID=UPI001BB26DC5|nr:beta-microseminoprotein-like [Lytechinus variegatus]XP_041466637.1 beta-microseminoprotein-like [Lytechinus variegatus]